MKKKIFIISASDRYNFGDLLFNYIISHYLPNDVKKSFNLYYVSLYGNDLTKYKGHKTISLKNMRKIIDDNDILIFAGGGLLGHKWTPMFMQVKYNILLKKLSNKFNNSFEYFIKSLVFKTNINYPFTNSILDYEKNVKIIYNSVGGGALNNIQEKNLEKINRILKNTSYLSVRDKNIKTILRKLDPILSPDSAILISELFTRSFLSKNIRDNVSNLINDDYIILHFNKQIAFNNIAKINRLINVIKTMTKLKIILMPVNFIRNSDIEGLSKFQNNHNCFVITQKINLYEICSLIANAKFLIGSSLHTNILATSYNIPHFGVTRQIVKVNNYFNTWFPKDSIFNSYDIEEIPNLIQSAINKNCEIKLISNELKAKALINLKNINNIIKSRKI